MSTHSGTSLPPIPRETHLEHLRRTIELARQSPPKPTNFRVGCVIVSFSASGSSTVLSTGYTLEHAGNTHAEQCALSNLSGPLDRAQNVVLYTSLEPCGLRLSGNTPCVDRIVGTQGGVRKVVFGAKEPGVFVSESKACERLTEAGVDWEYLPDLEREILSVAMEGHVKEEKREGEGERREAEGEGQKEKKVTRIDNITDEEKRRQEAMPRNPKKRMMEVKPGEPDPV